jgi:hypothetical protein
LMQSIVEAEKITDDEKQQILLQVGERIETLQDEIKEAQEAKNAKKQKNLEDALEKAKARKQKIQGIQPSEPLPLKNESQVGKLRKELVPLLEIEAAAKGRLMTIKESQALGRKDEILEEIQALQVRLEYRDDADAHKMYSSVLYIDIEQRLVRKRRCL